MCVCHQCFTAVCTLNRVPMYGCESGPVYDVREYPVLTVR